MNLQYKTRDMANPGGKPKVWFACHPEDFESSFELLTNDILAISKCTIWYDTDENKADAGALREILDDMQLAVFAVTSTFLEQPSMAKDVELEYAYEKHIPILPITLENGLGRAFNKACKPIQVVNRADKDPTAIPYEDVLKTYLNSVLVSDELAKKVRAAFDAYVFLSYRKKDRKYAQRLMHLIHENKEFRDIAIWYDEYLVPGEGFNKAIKDAFEKSSLFAMAVTPHLEEEGNYVMRVEYPMARDRKSEKNDIEIVPVEMYDEKEEDWRIDLASLRHHQEFKYREIRYLQNEQYEEKLNQAFLDSLERIAKKENDGSAQHRFFIGLAYLTGIDMEINSALALELIRSAAEDENPCYDATEKLVDMYLRGDGVPLSIPEAIAWQEKLCKQLQNEVKKNHSPDEHLGYGTRHFRALIRLSDLLRDAGDISGAAEKAEEALKAAAALTDEVGKREAERDAAVICTRLGRLLQEKGDWRGAEKYFSRAKDSYERLAYELGTARARRDLSIAKERLGDVARKLNRPETALEYYQDALKLREELAAGRDSSRARRDLSAILTKLGTLYQAEGTEHQLAKECFERAFVIDRGIALEERTDPAMDDLSVSLIKQGDVAKEEKRYQEAHAYYKEAYDILKPLAEKKPTLRYRKHYAVSCEKRASVLKRLLPSEEVKPLFEEAVKTRKALMKDYNSPVRTHELAVACFNEGVFADDEELLVKALELWQAICPEHPEYEKYKAKAEKALRLLREEIQKQQ